MPLITFTRHSWFIYEWPSR